MSSQPISQRRTIVEKIWDNHVVTAQPGVPSLIYIDLHLCHEVTTPQAFQTLRDRGLKVRRPDLTIATMDHSTPTTPHNLPILDTGRQSPARSDGKELRRLRHPSLQSE